MTKETTKLRRDLSGIYIFDTLPQDSRRHPTCIEDCREGTRLAWLITKEPGYLECVGRILNEAFAKLWVMLTKKEQKTIIKAVGDRPYCETRGQKGMLVDAINRFCKLMRLFADTFGICRPGSEADSNTNMTNEAD